MPNPYDDWGNSKRIKELEIELTVLKQLIREMGELLPTMLFPDMPHHNKKVKEILSRTDVKAIMEGK